MKKAWLTVIASSLCLLFIPMSGCSSNPATQNYADNPVAQRETLAQISTIDAILNGVYDGVVDFGTLKKYGDFGIGTFEGLDGEMLGFDGNFYQVKADGIAYPVSDSMETPFASVTFFEIDCNQDLPDGIDYEQLQDFLDDGKMGIVVHYKEKRPDDVFNFSRDRYGDSLLFIAESLTEKRYIHYTSRRRQSGNPPVERTKRDATH